MTDYTKQSKFISYVLRHEPEEVGLTLDRYGWTPVSDLLEVMANNGHRLTVEQLEELVATNSKKRFSFNENKTKIRANQGHSIEVDVQLKKRVPPTELFHGTATRFMEAIGKQGLTKQGRLHVHLSDNLETAKTVGQRHGMPTIITIDAKEMWAAGIDFYQSENGVWLTDYVDPKYFKKIN